MTALALTCQCGAVKGEVRNVSSTKGTRVVCYCDDCQAFANHLHSPETLNEFGGTDIYQTAPANIKVEKGREHLKSLKLNPKGIVRWYSGCCQTPIANTSPKLPFAGLIHSCLSEDYRDKAGPVRKHVMGQFAKPGLLADKYNQGFGLGLTLRVMRKMLVWKMTGQSKPNPFFGEDSMPVSKPEKIWETNM